MTNNDQNFDEAFYDIQYSPINKNYNDLNQRININNKKIKIYGSRKILKNIDSSLIINKFVKNK